MRRSPPEMVDYLLHHLLVDVTGSAHRAAFCIDKLYPTNNLPQRLGLLELRGFAMPPRWPNASAADAVGTGLCGLVLAGALLPAL